MKKFKESQSITQPVIYVGVEEQEAKGFDKVEIYTVNSEGLVISENHFGGEISIQMVNGSLKIYVKN